MIQQLNQTNEPQTIQTRQAVTGNPAGNAIQLDFFVDFPATKKNATPP